LASRKKFDCVIPCYSRNRQGIVLLDASCRLWQTIKLLPEAQVPDAENTLRINPDLRQAECRTKSFLKFPLLSYHYIKENGLFPRREFFPDHGFVSKER
jgi:hypothetical protein